MQDAAAAIVRTARRKRRHEMGLKIGLTGGIACGKSTVSEIFQACGAKIVDADKVVHELLLPQGILWHAYCEHFGPKILHPDLSIDRARVGAIVFSDEAQKKWLDAFCQPIVKEELKKRGEALFAAGAPLVIFDIPLLFEANWQADFDLVIVVYVDKKTQLFRLQKRNGYSFSQARSRLRAQWSLKRKCALADICIDNSGTKEEVKRKTYNIWKRVQEIGRQ